MNRTERTLYDNASLMLRNPPGISHYFLWTSQRCCTFGRDRLSSLSVPIFFLNDDKHRSEALNSIMIALSNDKVLHFPEASSNGSNYEITYLQ